MIDKFKKQNIIYKLMTIGLVLGICFFVVRVLYNVVMTLRFPNELLEPSNVYLTKMFLEGKSPYTLASLGYEVPAVNYEYPFLNSMICAAIAFLLGKNAVLAHYIVSFASIIGTGILGYLIIRPYSKSTAAPFAGALLFMQCHWRFGYVSAAPDDLGLLLFVLTLMLAVSKAVRNKPLVCAVMTTLCFYTKQYFIFVAAGIFIYMLLYSKKEAFKFLGLTALFNVIAVIVVNIVWPLYWTYTLFFLYSGTFSGIGFGFGSLFEQLKYLAAIFAGLFVVLVIAVIRSLRVRKMATKDSDLEDRALVDKALQGKKIFGYRVTENNPVALFVIEIPVMFLPLIFFGRNDGAFLSYFLQLWMPSIIVVTLITLEKMEPKSKQIIFDLFYGGVVAFTVLFSFLKMPLHVITDEEIGEWNKAYAIIDEYKEKGDVYYSQLLAYKAIEDGARYCLCGHDGEVSEETLSVWQNSKLCKILFPNADKIITKYVEYEKDLTRKAIDSGFELLTFIDGNSLMFASFYLDAGVTYEKLTQLTLQAGNMPYDVQFYVLCK